MASDSWLRKITIVPPLIAGALALGYVITGKTPPEQLPATEQETRVRVITLEKMPVIPRVLGYGTVQPGRVWNAVAQVAGRVERVHPDFKKGAILKAGTEIVRISPDDYKIAIRQAEANIRSAQAKIKELNVATNNTKASLAIEKQTLRINLREFERKRKLVSRGALSKSVRDQEERALLAQRKRVLDLESTLQLNPTQIAAQKESKAVSRTQLEAARLNLKRTSITLPFDARIAQANVEITQFAGVGKVLAIADSMQKAEVVAQIPVSHMRALMRTATKAEQKPAVGITPKTAQFFAQRYGLHGIVRMSIGDQSVEWQGKVVRISDTVDPKTRTIGVIVAVDNPYKDAVPGVRPPLIKGMFVEVEIRAKPLADQIVIPRSNLRSNRVLVVDADNRLGFRDIRIKLIQGDFAVIASGLKVGERVIVSDLNPAVEGMLLRATTDKAVFERLKRQTRAEGAMR